MARGKKAPHSLQRVESRRRAEGTWNHKSRWALCRKGQDFLKEGRAQRKANIWKEAASAPGDSRAHLRDALMQMKWLGIAIIGFCFGFFFLLLVVYLTHSSFLDTCLETSALQSPSLLITSSILPSCGDVLSTPICRERDRKLWDLSSGGQRAELGFDTGLKIPSPRLTHCIATISGLIPESVGSSCLSVCLLSASLRVKPHEDW